MTPMIWLGIMILFIAVEAVTYGLTTIWFAIGALCAAIAAYLQASLTIQLIIFCIVSIVMLLFTRPLALKSMKQEKVKTNVDSLIGKEAVVTTEINNLAQTGQVRINDIDWSARSENPELIISEKSVVRIEKVQGVKLYVSPVTKQK